MRFNLNDEIRVKLTDFGREQLRKNHNELFKGYPCPPKYRPRGEDADGWSTWQAWEIMRELGKYLYAGCDLPFETEIDIIIGQPAKVPSYSFKVGRLYRVKHPKLGKIEIVVLMADGDMLRVQIVRPDPSKSEWWQAGDTTVIRASALM